MNDTKRTHNDDDILLVDDADIVEVLDVDDALARAFSGVFEKA